jgi:3-hydroxyisobutyrate dehydrogenase
MGPLPMTDARAHTLGFVGLGHMGGPMSTRLVEAGHVLVGFDIAGTRERLPAGAEPAASVAELAATADVVLLSLPNGAGSVGVCEQVVAADGHTVNTVIDLSTIGLEAARRAAALLGEAGIDYVDAPVSGGVSGARAGTLSIMVGAPQPLFDRVRPLLEAIGTNIFRMGDAPGQGQAMKLLNNYCGAAALAATSEAVVFGARAGLDLAQMIEVLNVSSGRTGASMGLLPNQILPRTYNNGFAAALMAKDVGLFLEGAEALGTAHELAAAATALWRMFDAARPGADFTAIHKYIEDMS